MISENRQYNEGVAGRPPLKKAPQFGQLLARLRKARGMTQAQLAQRLGISLPMLIYYERRAKNPSADFVKRVGEVLNVSIDELLGHKPVRHVKTGPAPRLQKLMEQVSALPRTRQRFVVELLESYLQNRRSSG
jgi:transcriptional regulator with XRE-family HTH domain